MESLTPQNSIVTVPDVNKPLQPLEELQGSLERIVYTNQENHYTVAQLLPDHQKKLITIVGNLPSIQCGETLKLQGQWIHHAQFGHQFKISRYEAIFPSSITGLKKYLGSGLIRGIGPKFAERIVEHFGAETLQVIDQFSGRLKEVPGIGTQRASRIRLAWLEQKAVRDLMIFLQSYGVTTSQAAKIYKMYGEDSMSIVKETPYRLARDIYGIGFRTADQIAHNLGIPSDSAQRIQAGITYQLEQFLSEGHTCYPQEALVRTTAADLLRVEEGPVERQITQMAHEKFLKIEPKEDLIFLSGLYHAERELAERLKQIATAPITLPGVTLEKALKWADQQSHITMSNAQCEAVKAALTSKLTVITGGPGVGKTTIIRNIVKIMAYKKARIALCAPTGRAAKRLSESCSHFAQTIHRLLKYEPASHSFLYHHGNLLEVDLVIVDETSMLDILLAHHLLQAIPNHASIVLVGDIDQLPSVGPGNVLRDIIESKIARVTRLTQIFRQHHTSQIIVNAHRVNEGNMPENIPEQTSSAFPEDNTGPQPLSSSHQTSTAKLSTSSDFHLLYADTPEVALKRMVNLCAHDIPKTFGFNPIEEIQVMAPMHRGICGVENLNRELQHVLNPKNDHGFKLQQEGEISEIERFGRPYRIGDKVMQIKNNYDKDVFNGDMGRILSISRENQKVLVRVDERTIEYDFNDLDELIPAYAISIHKSQGSEYPAVVIPILTQHFVMLQRNLIYTAITRGKKLVVLVGSAKALAIAVRNDKTAYRYGMLKTRLLQTD